MVNQQLAKFREVLEYDPGTGEFRWLVNRNGRNGIKAGDVAGFLVLGYRRIGVLRKEYLAHRLAWLFVHGEWPRTGLDHINGNPSDNRIINLREANQTLNNANARTRCDSKSGIRGVSQKRSKWSAAIQLNGRRHSLGVFGTKEEAANAYAEAARRLFGEFAYQARPR